MPNQDTARKIFVSYKYKDTDVSSVPVQEFTPSDDTDYSYTPRHYVDKIINVVGVDHIYKGELGGEDLSHLTDDTIDSKLKEKIFDSSVTLVLISPNMWDKSKSEKDQWIPNEISYSLRDKTRNGKSSKSNAMLAVILPDANGSYSYAVSKHTCPFCNVTIWHTEKYFSLLRMNMFNKRNKNLTSCNACSSSNIHIGHDHSYIYPVAWPAFIGDHNSYIDHVISLKERREEFDLQVNHT